LNVILGITPVFIALLNVVTTESVLFTTFTTAEAVMPDMKHGDAVGVMV
jgi:hypothetical protein